MLDNEFVEQVVREVLRVISEERREPALNVTSDGDALARMKTKTSARIGVGKAGPRLKTKAMLAFRADHALAQESVFRDVSPEVLERLELFSVQTLCDDRNRHITRPDLGRQFSPETVDSIKNRCVPNPDVQICVSDGLSSKAVEANIENILPSLTKGLEQYGIKTGTPFFIKYGRVPSMDVVSDAIGSEVTCILIGERPGLVTAESMSAYIAYKCFAGMPESRRTVVSNIHAGGLPAVEAGAYIADVIKKMLKLRTSGVDLKT